MAVLSAVPGGVACDADGFEAGYVTEAAPSPRTLTQTAPLTRQAAHPEISFSDRWMVGGRPVVPVVVSSCGSGGGAPVDDQVVTDGESGFG